MCEELLVIGPESKFSPSERKKFGFGSYKYIGLTKAINDDERHTFTFGSRGAPVYLLSQNESSRIGLITRDYHGFWFGWVNYF